MSKWIIETLSDSEGYNQIDDWRVFAYAPSEYEAREKASKACLVAKKISAVRFRRVNA